MEMVLRQYDLRLRDTFTISRESYDVQPSLVVELRSDGLVGYGEATTNPFYGATMERLVSDLRSIQSWLAASKLDDPRNVWPRLAEKLGENRFAICAVDLAIHDLWARSHNRTARSFWSSDDAPCPVSDYTIGIDNIPKMIQKLNAFPGWPVYKIKLGTADDVAIVRSLREQVPAIFRVDANNGWKVDQAIDHSHQLKELGVEFIEQPLPVDAVEGQRRLFNESALPIIADESCEKESDVERCGGLFHGVNVKLVKCGGLTPALRMIERARQLKLQVMVGCMTESSVGISAGAQLLPLVDYADLDGAVLITNDMADGVRLDRGRVVFPGRPGFGIELKNPGIVPT